MMITGTILRTAIRMAVGAMLAGVVAGVVAASAPAIATEDTATRAAFTTGPLTAAPGTMVSGFLDIADGVDVGTKVPVTIAHGAKPGPVLALIAGTHGYEYAPVIALHRVRRALDPSLLSGTVIMVHVANMPSFMERTVYRGPVDGKNLNRVYPGRADGTVSDRIAHAITTYVIAPADYVLDLHAGDGNEALRPYIYMPVTGDKAMDRAIRDMALAFGLDHIVIDDQRDMSARPTRYTDQTALVMGKPAITTETGQLGSVAEDWVGPAERGVWNILRHFSMIPGTATPVENPVWLIGYRVVTSPADGVFIPAVRDGYAVAAGGRLGVLQNLFGEPVATIHAPFDGIVNYVVATPPVRRGEPLAMVSRRADPPD